MLNVYVHAEYTQADSLRQVVVKIISPQVCKRRGWYSKSFYEPTMLCAGYAAGGRDACLGDSGGPLQCFDMGGRWKLAGVVSYGNGCAKKNKPGVYTSIAKLLNWIKAYIPSRPLYYYILYCIILYYIVLYYIIFYFILYYILYYIYYITFIIFIVLYYKKL